MTASIYAPGSNIPLVNANSTLVPQNFTVTALPTTVFNLTAFTYVPGTGSLAIYINGVKQRPGIDFVETSGSSFTLLESPLLGDVVTAEGFVGITITIPDAEYLRMQLAAFTGAGMIGTLAAGFLSASTVQDNLQEIVTRFNTVLALQAVQIQTGVAYTTTGSSTAYSVDMTGNTVPADIINTRLQLTFDETNTNTTPTLTLTGWPTYPIKVFNTAGAKVGPAVGTIVANAIYDIVFEGTNFMVLNQLPSTSGTTQDNSTNERLLWIYQAKALLFARKGVNLFADGYKTSDGINAGSSSGYNLDTVAGRISPSLTSDANTVSLLSFEGANGATTTVDSSILVAPYTVAGAAALSTARAKFGVSSAIYNSSTATYWTTPDQAALRFGSGDLTVEGWIWINAHKISCFASKRTSGSTAGTCWALSTTATGVLQWSENSIVSPTTTTIPLGQWVHIAWVRSGSTNNIYINGVSGVTWTGSQNYSDTAALRIGSDGNGSAGDTGLNGNIDEFRMSTVARYTANFTPPTAGFAIVSNAIVISTSQVVVSSTKAKVLLEFDNVSVPTLNTDITAEVSCNGGTNWQAASLSLTGTGQSGRLVVESSDITCVTGTAVTYRLKTFNSKSIPIYGICLTNKP